MSGYALEGEYMAAPTQDRLAQILAIKQRAGRHSRVPSHWDLERLREIWEKQLIGIEPIDELLPIRIVTLLEVFLRHWIEVLVDHGAPYVERAAKLKVELKYDFAVAASVQGGAVTLGQLISHSVPLSRMDTIAAVFEKLLDQDLFEAVALAVRQRARETEADDAKPIIQDVDAVRRTLARLFEVRHVLVHEFPESKPHGVEEVSQFFRAGIEFMEAVNEELSDRVHGRWPSTQQGMNREAAARAQAAAEELQKLCDEIADKRKDSIHAVQQAWEAFKQVEAERQSDWSAGGSIRPLLFHLAAAGLTRARMKELREWWDESDIEW